MVRFDDEEDCSSLLGLNRRRFGDGDQRTPRANRLKRLVRLLGALGVSKLTLWVSRIRSESIRIAGMTSRGLIPPLSE